MPPIVRMQKRGPFDGRLRRPSPAFSNDRPIPERLLWLAGDRVLSMIRSKPAIGCHPQSAGHADLEAGAVLSLPVLRYVRRYKPPVRKIKMSEQLEIMPDMGALPHEER